MEPKAQFKEWLNRDSPDPLNQAELEATARDLAEMLLDEAMWSEDEDVCDFGTPEGCYREWLRRLGGIRNIPSYAKIMAAQAARKENGL